jgi:hypothetical protein
LLCCMGVFHAVDMGMSTIRCSLYPTLLHLGAGNCADFPHVVRYSLSHVCWRFLQSPRSQRL